MASPLVASPTNPLRPSFKSVASPLKPLPSAVTSSNGTPHSSRPAGQPSQAAQPPTMDLAEQMNMEERKKYVKGKHEKPPSRGLAFVAAAD